ncbi:MAG: hypothetical protein ACYSVY_25605, partial [Planctomycetota bacterium]
MKTTEPFSNLTLDALEIEEFDAIYRPRARKSPHFLYNPSLIDSGIKRGGPRVRCGRPPKDGSPITPRIWSSGLRFFLPTYGYASGTFQPILTDREAGLGLGLRLGELDAERWIPGADYQKLAVYSAVARRKQRRDCFLIRKRHADMAARDKTWAVTEAETLHRAPYPWLYPLPLVTRPVGSAPGMKAGRHHSVMQFALQSIEASHLGDLTACGVYANLLHPANPRHWGLQRGVPLDRPKVLWHYGAAYLAEFFDKLPDNFQNAFKAEATLLPNKSELMASLMTAVFDCGQHEGAGYFDPAVHTWTRLVSGTSPLQHEECFRWLCAVYAWLCPLVWLTLACQRAGALDEALETYARG